MSNLLRGLVRSGACLLVIVACAGLVIAQTGKSKSKSKGAGNVKALDARVEKLESSLFRELVDISKMYEEAGQFERAKSMLEVLMKLNPNLPGLKEKLDQLEDFHADRIAGRILGMGDIVSLVEKAMEATEAEEAEKLAQKMQKGQFDLNDMAQQMKQLQKMGGLGGIMGMLPGIGKMQKQLEGKVDEKHVKRSLAIISSMTPKERRVPDFIKASRKTRIAKGAGVQVQDVNKLLKQHQEMARMMKQVSKLGQKGLMRHGLSALMKGGPMGGGGMGGMGGGGGFGGMR